MMRHEIDAGGRCGWKEGERLRRGTSQVRLEWIIVKVHDELQHFHTPDFRGQRGKESLELGHVHSGQAHRKRIRSWVGYGPPFSLLTGILDLPPLQELKLQSFGSC